MHTVILVSGRVSGRVFGCLALFDQRLDTLEPAVAQPERSHMPDRFLQILSTGAERAAGRGEPRRCRFVGQRKVVALVFRVGDERDGANGSVPGGQPHPACLIARPNISRRQTSSSS